MYQTTANLPSTQKNSGSERHLAWTKYTKIYRKHLSVIDGKCLWKWCFVLSMKIAGVVGICVPCIRKDSINHYAFPDIDEYNSPRRCIEICDDDLEHAWIVCKLRGLDPTRETFQKFYWAADTFGCNIFVLKYVSCVTFFSERYRKRITTDYSIICFTHGFNDLICYLSDLILPNGCRKFG